MLKTPQQSKQINIRNMYGSTDECAKDLVDSIKGSWYLDTPFMFRSSQFIRSIVRTKLENTFNSAEFDREVRKMVVTGTDNYCLQNGVNFDTEIQNNAFDRLKKIIQEVLEEELGKELALFIENDSDLYQQQTEPIIKSAVRNKKNGTFDADRFDFQIRDLMKNGAKKYRRQFGYEFGKDAKNQAFQSLKEFILSVVMEILPIAKSFVRS